MHRLFKHHADPRLARKIARLRALGLLLGALVVAAVAVVAAGGEMTARGSAFGGRFVSDGVLRTIAWSDSPATYLAVATWYAAMGLLLVAGIYAVLARLVERRHGRPFFRRKYPY